MYIQEFEGILKQLKDKVGKHIKFITCTVATVAIFISWVIYTILL